MEGTLTRPTEDLKEKRTTKRLSGSFKRLRIKAKDKFSRSAKTTVTVEEVSEDQTKATPTCQDLQTNPDGDRNQREPQKQEQEEETYEQKQKIFEDWKKKSKEESDRLDRAYAEQQKKKKLEQEQRYLEQLEKDLELQRKMEERLAQEKSQYVPWADHKVLNATYDTILKEEANQRREQRERDQELQRKMEEKVREEKLRATSDTTAQVTEESSRPAFRPYTVSDWERERFQRMVLGMDSDAVTGSNSRGRHNYDVEVLW
jgi:hypothetical protein